MLIILRVVSRGERFFFFEAIRIKPGAFGSKGAAIMTSLVNYRGLEVPSSTFGAGGAAIAENFQILADWHPLSQWAQPGNPTASDDSTLNYYPGSLWLNSSTNELFLCFSSAPGAAVWQQVILAAQANEPNGYLGLNGDGVAEGILVGRTGTEAQLDAIVLNQGEWAFATDTKQPKVGDGVTLGGLPMVRIESNGAITVPDASGATVGEVRGGFATDLQAKRALATQVASGDESFIGSGYGNSSSGYRSFIGNGSDNTASGSYYSMIGNGGYNTATAFCSLIGTGRFNTASGICSVVVNGVSNHADGTYSSVINGSNNFASGSYATVLNGGHVESLGLCSTVLNGKNCVASGSYSTMINGAQAEAGGAVAAKSFQMALGCSTQNPDKIWQSWYSLSVQSSGTTATELTLDGNTPNVGTTEATSNRFVLVQGRAYFGTLKIVGKQSGSSNIAEFDAQIVASSGSSGSATLITISQNATNPNSWPTPTVQIGSGPTGFAGVLQVLCASPNTSTTIQWMCLFNCAEVTI